MRSVLPGVAEVLASFLLRHNMFMRLDLPTFERPMKAYSAFVSLGHMLTIGEEMEKSALLISMSIGFCLRHVLLSHRVLCLFGP